MNMNIQGGSKKVSCYHSTTAYFFEPPCMNDDDDDDSRLKLSVSVCLNNGGTNFNRYTREDV